MRGSRVLIRLLSLAWVAAAGGGYAQDSVRDVLRSVAPPARYWDNIEGSPQWVAGVAPSYAVTARRHQVTLAPGESTCVRVPGNEFLRMVGAGQPLSTGDVKIAVSNGSGLLAFGASTPEDDGSLLVDPARSYPMLVYVVRPVTQEGDVRLALYVSRLEPVPDWVDYRDQITLPVGKKVRLRTHPDADALRFRSWDRGQPVTLNLQGPARYRLDTRYRYPPTEGTLAQSYHILVRDADAETPIATVEYATTAESARRVEADGNPVVVGRLESGFFDLDADRTIRVRLESSAPVFARLLRLDDAAYVAPGLNEPEPRSADIAKALRTQAVPHSLWDVSESQLSGILAAPDAYPAGTIERAAMRLARDNSRTEGGIMAAVLLENAGARRTDGRALRMRGRAFSGFRTFYRDLPPDGARFMRPVTGYFSARTVLPPGEHPDRLVMGQQHIEAGFNQLPQATFHRMEGEATTSFYYLPDRATPATIRLVAMRESTTDRPVDFSIRIPGEAGHKLFRLLPDREIPWSQTRPTRGEAALRLLGDDPLDAPAALLRDPAAGVAAGFFTFTVPAHVERLELHVNRRGARIPIALQIKVSDVFALSEDAYLAAASSGDSHQPLLSALSDLLAEESPPAATTPDLARGQRELLNHWEPLRRYVRSRYRRIVDSVAPDGSMEPQPKRIANVDQLLADGEHFLAERLARYLYLYAAPPTRDAAWERLKKIAALRVDSESRLINACAAMVVEPNRANAVSLCRYLRQQGETELALMLASVLPAGDASTRDVRLACTFHEGWWAHFGAILEEDPDDPVCRIWRGLALWRKGQTQEARDAWERAGDTGRAWLRYVDATRVVRERILAGDVDALYQWARLEMAHPGTRVWSPVSPQRMGSHRASVAVHAVERETYYSAYLAIRDKPLELHVASPRRLRIECRPLHPPDADRPLEGWVFLESNRAVPRGLPVIANYRSAGLRLAGRPDEQPGTAIREEVSIDGWNTQMRVRPREGRYIVRVLGEHPEVRVGYLPPLDEETAAHLFGAGDRQGRAGRRGADRGSVAVVNRGTEVEVASLRQPFAPRGSTSVAAVRASMAELPRLQPRRTCARQRLAIEKMNRLLWLYRGGDSQRRAAVIAAASVFRARYLSYPELGRIHATMVQQTRWEPILAAESAGIVEREFDGWRPESPRLRRRLNLLPKLKDREQLIAGTDRLVAMVTHPEQCAVTLDLSLEGLPFLVPRPLRARVQWGDARPQEHLLYPSQPGCRLGFIQRTRQTSLRVDAVDAQPSQFLRVGMELLQDEAFFARTTRRNYFVATASEPLRVRIDGPSWVRVDRLAGEKTVSTYRLVRQAVETLSFSPAPAEEDALYRIHVLRLDTGTPAPPALFLEPALAAVAAPVAPQDLPPSPPPANVEMMPAGGGQEDGTRSLGVSAHRRRVIEEEERSEAADVEGFWQGELTHRYYNPVSRTYFRTTALGRIRQEGKETIGLEHSLQHRPPTSPFVYSLTGRGFAQDGEWSAYGRGSVSFTQERSPTWSHTPSLSVVARALSREDASPVPEEVDQDVYTEYKSEHPWGLRLRERLTYRPRRDVRLAGGVGLTTNDDMNPFDPDSLTYAAEAEQLLGPLRLGAELRGDYYAADEDRSASSSQHRLRLDATTEIWRYNHQRLEAGMRWTRFIEDEENALLFFALWHVGPGRVFRDFRPSERPFSDLRERRIPPSLPQDPD